MTDEVYEQIVSLKNTGKVNMFSVQEVFELALAMDYYLAADYIFMSTEQYLNFILTGERD